MTISPIDLGNENDGHGAHFEVRDKGKLFGRLSVGKDGLRWWPKVADKAENVGWKEFDKLSRKREANADE